MADTRTEWRTERRGERADSGWLDDRGVSEVIGSILVFGLLVSLLAIVQTQAVPDANGEVEFQHNKEVQRDFSKLSASLSRTSATGTSETVSIATGTTYPQRLVLYNPPAPTGSLRSSEGSFVFVRNVSGTDAETRDYVLGSLGTYLNTSINTSRVAYQPDYNRYDSAPVTALEYGVVYDDVDNGTLVESQGSIVDGKEIDLQLLGDGLQSSGQLTTTVRTEPVSTGNGISVRSLGDYSGTQQNLTLLLPTRMSESVWSQDLLANAIDDPGGANGAAPEPSDTCGIPTEGTPSSFGSPDLDNDRYIQDCSYIVSQSGPNYIQLKFEPNTQYQLRMSKLGFVSGSPDDPVPKYVVPEERSVSLRPQGQQEVSVEVRDRYNNPVSGVELIANISSGRAGAALINGTGTVAQNVTVVTDSDGTATASITTGGSFSGSEVTFKGDFDGDGVRGTVNPLTSSASTARVPENTTVSVSPAGVRPVTLEDASIVPGKQQVNLTVRNEGFQRRVSNVQLNYATVHEQKQVIQNVNTLTSAINLLTVVVGIQTGTTNASNVIDGPNSVDSIIVERPGGQAVGGSGSLQSPAVENQAGAAVVSPSAYPAIPQNGMANLTLTFDESIEADMQNDFGNSGTPSDMLAVSVTVTYTDGYRETYTTNLHAPEDSD